MQVNHFVSTALVTISLVVVGTSAKAAHVAQLGDLDSNLDNIGEITTSVLNRLGYECDTVANVGIVCKKCEAERFTEKCKTFICDAVTRKCRQQDVTLPNL